MTERWSTSSIPDAPIVGNQMHGITDKDVKGGRRPGGRAARRSTSWATRSLVGHSVGFDIGLPRGGARRRHPDRAGPLPRHADDRPRGLPGPRELPARHAGRFFGIELDAEPPRAARRRGDREPRCSGSRNDLPGRIVDAQEGIAGRHPRQRATEAIPTSCSMRLDARRASARACSGSSTRRPSASSSSRRASGWTAAASTRSARSRSRWASCRVPTAPACSPAARPRR